MKKVSAFTIIELLVAMAVAGIMVSIAVLLYLQLQRYIGSFSAGMVRNNDILTFTNLLGRDMDLSNRVEYADSAIYTLGEKTRVEYLFENKTIIRISESNTDTFKIHFQNLTINTVDEKPALVNSVFFEIRIDSDLAYPVKFVKEYPAQALFVKLNLYQR